MKKIIGYNYLHRHAKMEEMLGIDDEHVIIDKDEWEEIVEIFQNNSELNKFIKSNIKDELKELLQSTFRNYPKIIISKIINYSFKENDWQSFLENVNQLKINLNKNDEETFLKNFKEFSFFEFYFYISSNKSKFPIITHKTKNYFEEMYFRLRYVNNYIFFQLKPISLDIMTNFKNSI